MCSAGWDVLRIVVVARWAWLYDSKGSSILETIKVRNLLDYLQLKKKNFSISLLGFRKGNSNPLNISLDSFNQKQTVCG